MQFRSAVQSGTRLIWRAEIKHVYKDVTRYFRDCLAVTLILKNAYLLSNSSSFSCLLMRYENFHTKRLYTNACRSFGNSQMGYNPSACHRWAYRNGAPSQRPLLSTEEEQGCVSAHRGAWTSETRSAEADTAESVCIVGVCCGETPVPTECLPCQQPTGP